MPKRPYLTPEIDQRYQLVARRDGCLGLWGKTIFRGQYGTYTLWFREHKYYPIAQADSAPGIEVSVNLPLGSIALMREIATGYLYTWLDNLPSPKSDLLKYEHQFMERWKTKNTQLSVVLLWDRQSADWTVVPSVIDRLITVANIIKSSTEK